MIASMNGDPIIEALEEAIRRREEELDQLRVALEERRRQSAAKPRKRTRRRGFRAGSLPALIAEILKESKRPMTTAEIAIELKGRGRDESTRIVSASLSRYVKLVKVFRQTEDGRYELLEK